MDTPAARASMPTRTTGPFPPPVVGIVPGRTEDCDTLEGAIVGDDAVVGPVEGAVVGVVGPVEGVVVGVVGPVVVAAVVVVCAVAESELLVMYGPAMRHTPRSPPNPGGRAFTST